MHDATRKAERAALRELRAHVSTARELPTGSCEVPERLPEDWEAWKGRAAEAVLASPKVYPGGLTCAIL